MSSKSTGQQIDQDISDIGVFRMFKWGAIAIALCVALFMLGRVLGLFGTVANTATGVISRTLDPDNVIATYEGFHDRWKAFGARKEQIRSYQVVIDSSTGASKTTALVEQQAMMQSCRDIAARYNADSAKINRNIFKGKSAPAELNSGECK